MNTRNKSFSRALSCGLLIATLALPLASPPAARAGANDWTPAGVTEMAKWGYTHVGTFYATNFLASISNATQAGFPVPGNGSYNFNAGTVISDVGLRLEEQFNTTGGTLSSVTISVGDAADNVRFLSAAGLGTNVTVGTVYHSAGTNVIYNTATNLTFKLTPAGGATLAQMTNGGRFKIFLRVRDLSLP